MLWTIESVHPVRCMCLFVHSSARSQRCYNACDFVHRLRLSLTGYMRPGCFIRSLVRDLDPLRLICMCHFFSLLERLAQPVAGPRSPCSWLPLPCAVRDAFSTCVLFLRPSSLIECLWRPVAGHVCPKPA